MKLLGRGRERNGALTKVGVAFWGRQFVDNDNEDNDNEDNYNGENYNGENDNEDKFLSFFSTMEWSMVFVKVGDWLVKVGGCCDSCCHGHI